jgi:hypothetical protein
MKHLGKILLAAAGIGVIAVVAGKKDASGGKGQTKDGVNYGTAHQTKKIEGYEFYPQMASWKVWRENDGSDFPWAYRVDIVEGHFEEGNAATEADIYQQLDATLVQNGYKR